MSAADLVLIGVAVAAVAAAVGAFAIAYRRSDSSDWRDSVSPETVAADRSKVPVSVGIRTAAGAVEEAPEAEATETEVAGTEAEDVAEPAEPGVVVVEEQRLIEVSPEEAGVTRRQFFNRALGSVFGIFLASFGAASLAFLWPKLSGGFGSDINAGKVAELKTKVFTADGFVLPIFIPEAKAYVVPYDPAKLSDQFKGKKVAEQGLMALYQRCVHLGCRVPWCSTSQGFECPCHGSKYDMIGEYFTGPAPRNLDRFTISVNPADELVIHTGTIIQTPRAPARTVKYPQGPSCIGGGA